jgi:hypothetical protein
MQIFCIAFRNRHALTRTLYKLVQLGTSCQCAATPWYKFSKCRYPLVQLATLTDLVDNLTNIKFM